MWLTYARELCGIAIGIVDIVVQLWLTGKGETTWLHRFTWKCKRATELKGPKSCNLKNIQDPTKYSLKMLSGLDPERGAEKGE